MSVGVWACCLFTGPKARLASLFVQGLQTRGPLELDLGDRIGSL